MSNSRRSCRTTSATSPMHPNLSRSRSSLTIPPCSPLLVRASATPSARSAESLMSKTESTTPSAGPRPTSKSTPVSPPPRLHPHRDRRRCHLHPRRRHHRPTPHCQWPTLHRSCPPGRRDPPIARRHREHRLQQFIPASSQPWLAGDRSRNCRRRTRSSARTCSNSSPSRHGSKAPTLGTGIAKVQRRLESMHLPPTVRIEYGGTYQEQQQSFHEFLRVLLLSLALVFGVLLTEFRNFSAPIAILTSSVLSIAGVVFALLITGTTFNVASFMGLIMVIGIVAKNGILLLDADERFRRRADEPGSDAMIHAAQRRLRPILMTATAAICGMLPLAFAHRARIADASAPGHRGDRRARYLDGAQPDCHAGGLLPAHSAQTL